MYQIIKTNFILNQKYNTKKYQFHIKINSPGFQMNDIVMDIFRTHLENYMTSKKSRIGFKIETDDQQFVPLHIEFSSLKNVSSQIKSIDNRLNHVFQSNKTFKQNEIIITATILSVK